MSSLQGQSLRRFGWILLVSCLCFAWAGNATSGSPADQERTNLHAFARLYGLIRWFHPSDQAVSADWDAIALAGVQRMRIATDDEDLADRLQRFFSPYAPTVRVLATDDPVFVPEALSRPDVEGTVFAFIWEHEGVGSAWSDEVMGGLYSSNRTRMMLPNGQWPAGVPPAHSPVLFTLGEGLKALVPLTLYANTHGTFPQDSGDPSEIAADVVPDATTIMLADAIVIWNVMEHFYPYFDVVEVDWDLALDRVLDNILEAGSAYSIEDLEADLLVPLRDGHGWIDPSPTSSPATIPDVTLAWIDQQLVVASVGREASASGLRPGDVIDHMNDVDAALAFELAQRNLSGSVQLRERLAAQLVLSGGAETFVQLTVCPYPEDEPHQISVRRSESLGYAPETLGSIVQLEPGILYVDASQVTDSELQRNFAQLSQAAGILIDARGYIATQWAVYFINRALSSMQLRIAKTSWPNQIDVSYNTSSVPLSPYGSFPSECKLVFLINAYAVSAAEHQLSYFVRANIGTFVGTPTAGANGNVNRLLLPSGNRVTWTGMIAEWSDGSPFHARGIQPDVLIGPTRKGLAEGRDEIFEAGLGILRQQIGSNEDP